MRVVLGYHGTDRRAARAILESGAFTLSRNLWDWLGAGVYFWEYGPVRALEWARERLGRRAAVLRASIRLDGCLDLTDLRGTRELKRAFAPYCDKLKRVGGVLPRQWGGFHGLDGAVIDFLAERERPRVRVVRAPFVEGERLWEGSDLWEKAHIQLAVRDPRLISKVVLVREPNDERF